MSIGKRVGADLRFLTLTSSPASRRLVQKSLQILVKRIRRSQVFGPKFEYCCVRTSGNLGVMHLLYRGKFIPQSWLKRQWFEIHSAFEVWISRVEDRKVGIGGVSRYLVSQYMSNQSSFVLGSASRHWNFVGASRVFRHLLKLFGYVDCRTFRT